MGLVDEYKKTFKKCNIILKEEDSIPEEALRRAEQLRGFKIPEALRTYYNLIGNREWIYHVGDPNYLFKPVDLLISEGYLVFMEDEYVPYHYGVPLLKKDSDPEVFGLDAESDVDEWTSTDMSCSTVLQRWTLYSSLYSFFPYRCENDEKISLDLINKIKKSCIFEGEYIGDLYSFSGMILHIVKYTGYSLVMGATSREQLIEFGKQWELKLNIIKNEIKDLETWLKIKK